MEGSSSMCIVHLAILADGGLMEGEMWTYRVRYRSFPSVPEHVDV